MAIKAENVPAEAATLIERIGAEALGLVGSDDDIVVRMWGRPLDEPPRGAEAEGGMDGVSLHASLLPTRHDVEPEWFKHARLGFILAEEIGHVLLARVGVPNEPGADGEFFHELFATWLQFSLLATSDHLARIRRYVTTTPIDESDQLFVYALGKHLGAAMAGSQLNRAHLEAWAASGHADEEWLPFVREVEKRLELPLTPEAVRAEYDRAQS